MFDNLTQKLGGVVRRLGGKAALTAGNIEEALQEVRRSLLEADVALPVVTGFVERVGRRAQGEKVGQGLTPGQTLIKIVQGELTALMGGSEASGKAGEKTSEKTGEGLNLRTKPPAVILMAGLQGAGKTTTAAKLALFLKSGSLKGDSGSHKSGGAKASSAGAGAKAKTKAKDKKSVMLVSADIYRPAAQEQLQTLAAEVGVEFFASGLSSGGADGKAESTADKNKTKPSPLPIVEAALKEAKQRLIDVLIVDTAGRLAIDAEMMDEIKLLHKHLKPIETLFVVDAMTGQDAAVTAKAFNDSLPLTGVVLSKADGDARGGAALSVRQITGKPIKFLGMGEKVSDADSLQAFHPERIASRILGMGDVLSLIEEAERKVDHAEASRLVHKAKRGKGFDLNDFRAQLQQMREMGGMAGIMEKIPGMAALNPAMQQVAAQKMDDSRFRRMEVIIDSMTPKERARPDIIDSSRKRRIAAGSGTQTQDLNGLLKQHKQMGKGMKKMKGGGMEKMMQAMGSGGMPGMPGMGGMGGMAGGAVSKGKRRRR